MKNELNGIEALKELLKGDKVIAKRDQYIGNPSYDDYGIWEFDGKHFKCTDSDGYESKWNYGSIKFYKYPFFNVYYPIKFNVS